MIVFVKLKCNDYLEHVHKIWIPKMRIYKTGQKTYVEHSVFLKLTYFIHFKHNLVCGDEIPCSPLRLLNIRNVFRGREGINCFSINNDEFKIKNDFIKNVFGH